MLVDIACIVKIEPQSPNRKMESQIPNRKIASQNPNRKIEYQTPNRKMESRDPNRKMESKDQSRKKESQNQVHLYESTPIYCLKRHSYNEALDYFLSAETRSNHRHSNSGPPFFLIWSLPRLWYGSLSGSISLNHLSIFYNISCHNSLVLLTFVSRSSCRITYIYIKV